MGTFRWMPGFVWVAVLAASLALAACSDDDDAASSSGSGSITVLSASGDLVLSGTWVGCSGASAPYEKNTYQITGTTMVVSFSEHGDPACTDAGTNSGNFTATLATNGTKSMEFSSDGSTPGTPPPGVTDPLDVTKLTATVTESTVPDPPVGGVGMTTIWVDDQTAPFTLYREHANSPVDANGYAEYLDLNDTLIQQ